MYQDVIVNMTSPILILAVGNESRGDDALAPLLLRQLEEHANSAWIELLEDFQLQIEHAADLVDRDLVLFVDAGMDTPAPYFFYRVRPDDGRTLFSHALAPEAVLTTYLHIYKQPPPPSYVLCICGEQFELGTQLTQQARQHLQLALKFMQKLLREPRVSAWEGYCI